MATNGIRQLNGVTNSYPVETSLSGTAVWNTEYRLGSVSALSFTVPAYITDAGCEIRIVFTASSNITASITLPSGVTGYGFSDISISNGNSYEMSIVPISNTAYVCLFKEWS